ncbi:acid type B receptor subunit 1 [Seminavis robusta]|uniref:Acid type B receptor subunit 1 n=1 Tax=Seminavis robusta TaxID=568900 RepID=A0A9N8EQM9_9STRA|nr:acid type B receptor subunit 1 [Seminavis robusta]|eukprot:Sro1521_g279510.1 acid type B receptor subunit 1 (847) ;mRNA; f:22960-25500
MNNISTSLLDDDSARGAQSRGRMLGLMGYTRTQGNDREIHSRFLELSASVYLAWRELEERRGDILSGLPALLVGCDVSWDLELRDTRFSEAQAVNQLLQAMDFGNATNTTVEPTVIIGPLLKTVAKTVTVLAGGGLGIPQVSVATSPALEGSPLFARTTPTDINEARAIMTYLHSLVGTPSVVANVFLLTDLHGNEYSVLLQNQADRLGITFQRFAIQEHNEESIEKTIQSLRASGIKYIVPIMYQGVYEDVVRIAYRHGIIGNPEYFWLFQGKASWPNDNFGWDRETDGDLANALDGVGTIQLQVDPYEPLDIAAKELRESPEQWAGFVSKMAEPELFVNFTPPETQTPTFRFFAFDAVVAMGLAACRAPNYGQDQKQLYDALQHVEFNGTSGHVSFGASGSRASVSTQYIVWNLVLSEARSTNTTYHYDAQTVAMMVGDQVQIQNSFVYSGNTTTPPPPLPPLRDYDYNLVPLGAHIVGLCMGGTILLISTFLIAWTLRNKDKFAVRSAQPTFLVLLLCGVIIMACTIIPMTFQGKEESTRLDRACMSIPWLLCLGFVCAMSAILAKAWRLEQISSGAQGMRRVTVTAKQVMKPFFVLLIWNATVLTVWTVVSPYHYVRQPVDNTDRSGRNLESYGVCRITTNSNWKWIFFVLLGVANVAGVLFTAYKCYQVRNKSFYFSETVYLTWSMASLLETGLVGGPFLLVARNKPTAHFLVSSALICITCLAFVLPMYAFKYNHIESAYSDAKRDEARIEDINRLAVALDGSCDDGDDVSLPGRLSIHRSEHSTTHVLDSSSQHSRTPFGGGRSKTFGHRKSGSDGKKGRDSSAAGSSWLSLPRWRHSQ